MWNQADPNTMTLKTMIGNGWLLDEEQMKIQWDSEENIKAVKTKVATLLRGCSCKKGCNTARCGFRKKNEEYH